MFVSIRKHRHLHVLEEETLNAVWFWRHTNKMKVKRRVVKQAFYSEEEDESMEEEVEVPKPTATMPEVEFFKTSNRIRVGPLFHMV